MKRIVCKSRDIRRKSKISLFKLIQLNQTIEDLSQKISSIMSKMDEGNYDNRIEEKKPSINLQKSYE